MSAHELPAHYCREERVLSDPSVSYFTNDFLHLLKRNRKDKKEIQEIPN